MNYPTFALPVQSSRFAIHPFIALLAIMMSFDARYASAQTAPPPASPAPQFEGSLDKVEVGSLGGWAWDASRPNVAIKVDVYDGEKLLATTIADGPRGDLKTAGKGDGNHAFNYPLPSSLRDGQSHTISVRYSGTKTDLPGSPKTLVFPK
jgi:hypothetical protein